ETDLEIEPRAVRDPTPDIAPEVVGPKDVTGAERRQERLCEPLLERVIRREHRRCDGDEDHNSEQQEAKDKRGLEADPPHGRRRPCHLNVSQWPRIESLTHRSLSGRGMNTTGRPPG